MQDLLDQTEELFQYTQVLRRDFHQHPELGFQEVRTAGIVARELNELGLEVSTGIAETGVIALIEMARSGPTVLLRFDMDALPIQEESDTDYASQYPGLMHACGHDGHTAIGLTVARLLNARKENLSGKVKLVFQPAEEGLGGAERMVAEGVLENPKPDYILALHLWNEKPIGWLGITPGPAMAGAEVFEIKITGKGGHGASPHRAVDPVLASAHVITALQSITSRNVAPLKSAVVSVTTVRAGEAFNVIPPYAELKGTIRSFEPEVREKVVSQFHKVVSNVSEGLGCETEISVRSITPPVINDPHIAQHVLDTARKVFPDSEIASDSQTMGSEDMAFMMNEIPGCYFFIGSANREAGLDAAHHHPRFDFDERALTRGAALMTAATVDLLD